MAVVANSWRPSAQLEALLDGSLAWDDAAPAIRSWARLAIYREARRIIALPTLDDRRDAVARSHVRPQLEAEIRRLWGERGN